MVYAGLGMSVIFIDKIMACKNRPQKLNDAELQRRKNLLL